MVIAVHLFSEFSGMSSIKCVFFVICGQWSFCLIHLMIKRKFLNCLELINFSGFATGLGVNIGGTS